MDAAANFWIDYNSATLKKGATGVSEVSVSIYETIWCHVRRLCMD
jgi:hypothetical protein